MSDKDPEVRLLAAKRWGPLKNKAAGPVLKKALKDKSDYVRIAAAESLFRLGDRSGVETLKEIVRNAPEEPKEGTTLGVVLRMRRITLNKIRIAALNALSRMGDAVPDDFLEEMFSDADGSIRDTANVALARRGHEESLSEFIEALGHDDSRVRERAVRALGEASTPRTVDILKPFSGDPVPRVRAALMSALGDSRSIRAIPILTKGLADENEFVKAKAVEALGQIPSSDVIPLLRKVLEMPDNIVIELHAAAGLASLGETVGLGQAGMALSQRKDHDVRHLAIGVFETVGGNEAVEQLEPALDDTDAGVRVRAAAALVKLLQRKNGRASD